MNGNAPQTLPKPISADGWLREGVTTVIAIAVIGVTIFMLVSTFESAGGSQAIFSQQKDILLYSLSLLGTVIGYYFGRVPAELHADQARSSEAKALSAKAELAAEVRNVVPDAIAAVEDSIRAHGIPLTAAGVSPPTADLTPALTSLKGLLARVGP